MNTVIVWMLFVAGNPSVAYYNQDRCIVHAQQLQDLQRVSAFCLPVSLIGLPPEKTK